MKKVRILGLLILLGLAALSLFTPFLGMGGEIRYESMPYFYALMAIGLFLTTRKSKKEKEKIFECEVVRHSKLKQKIGSDRLKKLTQSSIVFATLGLVGVILTSIWSHETLFWLAFCLMLVGVFSGICLADPKTKITSG